MEAGYPVNHGNSSRKTRILDTRGLSGVPGWQTGGQRDNNRFRQDMPSQCWGYASDGIYMPQEHRVPRLAWFYPRRSCIAHVASCMSLAVLDRRATGVATSVGLGSPVSLFLSLPGPASRPSSLSTPPHLSSPHPVLAAEQRNTTSALSHRHSRPRDARIEPTSRNLRPGTATGVTTIASSI
jgi:hypothetical protein